MPPTNHVGHFAPVRLPGSEPGLAPSGYREQFAHIALLDRAEIASGVEAESKVYAGDVSWDFIPVASLSSLYFDDAGSGQSIDFGDAKTPDALIDGQDIATAAGSCSLLKTVDIAKHGDPLWKLLGYATRAEAVASGPKARLYFTIKGAALGANTSLAWTLVGTLA